MSDGILFRVLGHPLTRGLDLDDPETTRVRREIVLSKPFLRSVYLDWYEELAARIPAGPEAILEIGAGGGFLDSLVPGVIRSELLVVPGVDLVADAHRLPMADGSLKAILMTNVFHHLSEVDRFLSESERVLVPGGRVVMIEPWNTGWSRFVHRHLHAEAMDPMATQWRFPSTGPLSGANAALPWIVAERDRNLLEAGWELAVSEVVPIMPFRYIVSGGVSLRSLQPGWLSPLWRWIDDFPFLRTRCALFAIIVLERE